MQILSQDSILRKVPACLNPKQALFVDGIRHSAEIIELAYGRLVKVLTEIAIMPPEQQNVSAISASVFLDAWAIIDAIDRFRMLYQQMPGISFPKPELCEPTFEDLTKPFRALRNVADHLAQRADSVISKKGTALGVLSWITLYEVNPPKIWLCTLRPGTVRVEPKFQGKFLETAVENQTDQITLQAGGFEGNISNFLPQVVKRVRHFEKQLEVAFSNEDFDESLVASDVYMRQSYTLREIKS
ncbi:hypothetical protein [Rheinheimera sp.]|uniref:hypothetical protein n=1 Tax=Rheinheimera sp. TaxID=1869214 RepID=UPI003AF769A3